MGWQRLAPFTGHTGSVFAVVPAAGADNFLSAGGDGLVVRWNIRTLDQGLPVARLTRGIFCLHATEDGRYLLIGDEDGGLHRVDLHHQQEDHFTRPHTKGIFRITALHAGHWAVAGGDGELGVWTTSGSDDHVLRVRQIPLSTAKLRDLALSPLGSTLAVACGDGSLRLLDSIHFNEVRTIAAHDRGTSSVAWHPVKPVLVSGGKDGVLRCWPNKGADKPVLEIQAHTGAIYAIAFSANGKFCATAGRDRTLKIWDAHTFDPIARLDRTANGHDRSVNACSWIGNTLISASDDRTVLGWAEV